MGFLNKFYFCVFLSFPVASNEMPISYFFTDYNKKIANLAAKEVVCSDKTRVLNKNIFKGIKISSEDISVILEYKDMNAFISCSNNERLEYYKASILLRLSSTNHTNVLNSSDELISLHEFWLLKSKDKYEKIDSGLRKEIDLIKELDKPFNLITSYEILTNQ